jgi:cysteinyl-tRNA synthetase
VVGTVLALSGCATQPGECDAGNRDAGLFTKVNCDAGGGYRAQIQQNELALAQSQQENAMFHQVYEDIAAQQAASRANLQAQQQAQATLNQSLNNSLKARTGNKAQVQQQIAGLEQQLKAAQVAPVSTSSPSQVAAKQQELKALQKKVNQLQFSLGYE